MRIDPERPGVQPITKNTCPGITLGARHPHSITFFITAGMVLLYSGAVRTTASAPAMASRNSLAGAG